MKRRLLLNAAGAVPLLSSAELLELADARARDEGRRKVTSRVRPGDAGWPSEESWNKLRQLVGGRLVKVESPVSACREAPNSPATGEVFKALRNPYYIGDHPGLTQTSDGSTAGHPSPASMRSWRKTEDVVAAVNFARENKRLLVEGRWPQLSRNPSPPGLSIDLTREMNAISLHEAFLAKGCEGKQPRCRRCRSRPARWLEAYEAVTTRAGRYVQGAAAPPSVCRDSFKAAASAASRKLSPAAAGLLEAEVVTADGVARIANAHQP